MWSDEPKLTPKKEIVQMIWNDKCSESCSEWTLSIFQRWFYSMKAILCIWFNLIPEEDIEIYNHIPVCHFDFGQPAHHEYGGAYWTNGIVGHGYFSNWWYGEEEDASI